MFLPVLIFYWLLLPSFGLNILVWSPSYGQSHVNFMGNIADTLADAGHNVTMLVVENDPDVRKTGAQLVGNVLRYSSPLVRTEEWSELHFKQVNIFHLRTFELSDYLKMENINYRICQGMLEDPAFLNVLKSSRFDIMFLEMFHFCPAGIAHLTGVPKIVLASALGMTLAHNEFLGFYPTLSNTPAFLAHYGSRMSFAERVHNVLFYCIQKALYLKMYYSEQFLFSRYHAQFPDLIGVYKEKTDYILLNSNEFTEPVRPVVQSVKYIGGAGIPEPLPLPQDLEAIMKTARRGAILFSLGSIVRSGEMPFEMRKAFLEAFRSFPEYEFIWKDDVGRNSSLPNVHYRSWLPQVDLLSDNRLKVFITHGGLNSIQESLLYGVPMVILPIFADQDGNAALACERGYGVNLSKFGVTKEAVVEALREVIGEEGQESTYTAQARMASRMLKGSPRRMREEIRRAAIFSAQQPSLHHLKFPNHLSALQYFNIDVYFSLIFVFLGATSLTILFVKMHARIFSFSSNLFKKNL